METPTSSSFIPHENLAVSPTRRVAAAGLPEVMMLFSILVLVVSAGLAGAVFLYEQYLQTSTASKVSQLKTVEAAFQPALIVQLERLDDRMLVANTLLHNHVAVTALFKALEQATDQNIAFSSFSFDASDPTHMSIRMAGVAASVNSVALQSDYFGKSGVFVNPILSGVNRALDGVHFDFSALVNPQAVNYATLTTAAAANTSTQTQQGAVSQFQQQQPVASQSVSTTTTDSGASSTPSKKQ